MKSVFYICLGLVCMLLVLRLSVGWLEPRLTFHPLPQIITTPSQLGIEYKEYRIDTSDGEKIVVWHLLHPEPEAEILFFHGNAGNLSIWLEFLVQLYQQHYSVVALDYRGYGESTGSPSEKGIYEDSRSFVNFYWQHLRRPEVPILYFGRSLGGVTAAFATTVRKPDGLVLEATFPDKATFLQHYPFLRILNYFARYRFPTIEFLNSADFPVLVIHGDQDEIVPLSAGRRLFELIQAEKELFIVEGAHHNAQYVAGAERYWDRLEKFVRKCSNGQDSA